MNLWMYRHRKILTFFLRTSCHGQKHLKREKSPIHHREIELPLAQRPAHPSCSSHKMTGVHVAPTTPALHLTLGAMEIGIIINVFLSGVVTMQSYYYYSRFVDDRKFLRWFVSSYFVWIFELAHCGTLLHSLYELTVTFYGNQESLIHPPHSLTLTMITGGISTALVQGYLAWRVYRLSNVLIVAIICWTLTLVRYMGCLAVSITGYHMVSWPQFVEDDRWIFISLLLVGMVNDIIITSGLCFTLIYSRKGAQRKTTAIIDKLILWTLGTGLVTSLCSMLIVICYFTMPHNFIWAGIYTFSAKLYSNALLAILNGRASLRINMTCTGIPESLNFGTSNSCAANPQSRVLDIAVSKVQGPSTSTGSSGSESEIDRSTKETY
ncbi:hypothetical protein DL96DRAFT_1614942 [Flagelloscypha sp. PMI_526]|nr:hypothetical protein DL96DRAFT_1614942 [Flagelloscypha sp. PMI_526]